MARWRLITGHYLNVPGTQWEYKEIDRTSGKQGRKVFDVPMLLDPNDPADHNYPGEIIVANKASTINPRDILFLGEPTPEMEPLDDEARTISASIAHKWKHPIESLSGQSYSQSLLDDFQKQLAVAMSGKTIPSANPVSVEGISRKEFEAMQTQIAELTARNQELETTPKAAGRRA